MKYEPRRREAMKFAPAKKICDFSWSETSPASLFHEIFENRDFQKNACAGLARSKTMTGMRGPDQNEAQTTPDIEQIPPEHAT